MTQYMLSYPIKTHNAMMDLNNIDKAVFHHRMHPEQLTLPKMFCGTILSIVSVAKKNALSCIHTIVIIELMSHLNILNTVSLVLSDHL